MTSEQWIPIFCGIQAVISVRSLNRQGPPQSMSC